MQSVRIHSSLCVIRRQLYFSTFLSVCLSSSIKQKLLFVYSVLLSLSACLSPFLPFSFLCFSTVTYRAFLHEQTQRHRAAQCGCRTFARAHARWQISLCKHYRIHSFLHGKNMLQLLKQTATRTAMLQRDGIATSMKKKTVLSTTKRKKTVGNSGSYQGADTACAMCRMEEEN